MNKNALIISGCQGCGKTTLSRQIKSALHVTRKDLNATFGLSAYNGEEYIVVDEARLEDLNLVPTGDTLYVQRKGKETVEYPVPKFVIILSV